MIGEPPFPEIEKRAIGFLQESDGSKSSTRLCVVLIVVFSLGFIAALLWKIHGPITAADFGQAVSSLALFAGTVCGALYGSNCAREVFLNRGGKPPES